MAKEAQELVFLDQAERMIIKAGAIDEIKNIIDKAEIIRSYAKKAQKGLVIQNRAAEIKLLAERQAGNLIAKNVTAGNPQLSHGSRIGLKELGVNKDQSSRWQAVASLPEKDFRKHVAEVKDSNRELTTVGVIQLARDIDRDGRISREREDRKKILTDIDLRKGDFKKVLKDVENIDAIITDPPYPKEYLNSFSDLAIFAQNHLKKTGFIAVYSGQYHLPEVITRLSKYLTYVWTFCLYHAGKSQLVNGVNIMCGWKPVLIFSNGVKKMRFSAYDVLLSEKREKSSHEWQQSESGAKPLIELFSKPGELVVDPFAGSGTFLKVAHELGRKAIGADL